MEIKLRPYTSIWARRLALYFGLYVVIISSHIYFSRFDIWHTDVDSARYMLSSLIQSEAAIVALVVTLSLVAVQLAASSYSTRIVDVFIKTPDLWILILIYGIAMFYGLIVLKFIEKADPQKCAEIYVCHSNLEPHITLSYFLGVFVFVALVPYIWNTVRLLKPAPLFDRLTEEITNKSILDTIHNEQIKTDKESTLQPILDIVNGSIMKYDYGTAKYGLKAIGNKANDILKNRDIDKKEKKEISEHIFSHIVSVGQLAISKDNERSTSEIIAILCSNGIISVEQELEEIAFKAIKSIRLLGVDALNNKLEFLAADACSSLRKVGEKSVEKDLKILTKQGGWWEISSIKDIGMISAKYELEYSIMVVANSIDLIGSAAVKHRLKGTIQMAIDSLEAVGMEAAKYKFIGGIRNVSASLGCMKDEMFGKEEFKNEEQKAGFVFDHFQSFLLEYPVFCRNMRAVIPFKKSNAKSRLSSLLSKTEREELAMAMLNDVAGTLVSSGCFDVIDILSTSMIDVEGANTVLTEMGLNEALNEYLGKMSSHNINEPVLIIMADIPLVSQKNIKDMVSTNADIVIAPGRMGGTNAIFIRNPSSFHVDYYGASFLKHREIAHGLHSEIFDSFNISTDIDEVSDLTEVLLHGKGQSREYLEKIGLNISANGGRVGVKRLT